MLLIDLSFLVFCLVGLLTREPQIRILFIGNSYTYRNDMPDIFEHIAISKGKQVYVHATTKGKATLFVQANRDEVFRSIRDHQWDYVIIQGASRDFIQPFRTIQDTTLPAMDKIIRAVRRNKPTTKILLYMTWGYKNGYVPLDNTNTYDKMTQTVRDQYIQTGFFYNFGIVPVGVAFQDARRKKAGINLYVKDGAHPSLKGSYLAACCFYAAIFNESAIGSDYYSKLGPKICYFLQSVGSKNVLYQRKKYNLINKEVY